MRGLGSGVEPDVEAGVATVIGGVEVGAGPLGIGRRTGGDVAGQGVTPGLSVGRGVHPGPGTGSVSEAGGESVGPSAVVPSPGPGAGVGTDGPGDDGASEGEAGGAVGNTVGCPVVADGATLPANAGDGLPAALRGVAPGAPPGGPDQAPNPTTIVAAVRAMFRTPSARTRWTRSIGDTTLTLSSVGHSRPASQTPRRSC